MSSLAPSPTRPAPVAQALALAAGAAGALGLAWRWMDFLGDTFWYVATGRWILQHHALPREDPFAFTTLGRPWVVHMPGSQILFAWLFDHGGPMGLAAVCALVLAAAFTWAWLGGARTFAGRALAYPWVLLALASQADDMCARGQVFGDLAFVAFLVLLRRLRDARGWSTRAALAFAGAALSAVWIELHASVLVAPLIALVLAVPLGLEPEKEPRRGLTFSLRASAHRGAGVLLLGSAAALGAMANPYGVALPADLLRLAGGRSTAALDLFQPPDLTDPLVLLGLATGVALSVGYALRRSWAWALLFAGLVAASLGARRYLELLSLATLLLGGSWADEGGRILEARSRSWAGPWPLASTVLLGASGLGLAIFGATTPKNPWRDVPVAAATVIEAQGLPDHVFHPYHWGGYLDFAWAGRRRVFIDGRNQLFEGAVFDDYLRITGGAPGWERTLVARGIRTVLVEAKSPLDEALSKHPLWRTAHRDPMAAVHAVRAPQGQRTTDTGMGESTSVPSPSWP